MRKQDCWAKSHSEIDSDKERRKEKIVKEINIKTLGFSLDFPQHETLCTRVDKKPNREYQERENLFIE